MPRDAASSAATGSLARRRELASRLTELGQEMQRLRLEYATLAQRDRLGAHLLVCIGGQRAFLPSGDVEETIPLIRLSGAPSTDGVVAGSFAHRGVLATAVDIAALIGGRSQKAKMLVVLAGAPRVAMLVEDVPGVLPSIDVTSDRLGETPAGGCLVAGLVRDAAGGAVVLDPEFVRRLVRDASALPLSASETT